LVRGPGARPLRLRLPGDSSAAEAVTRLVGTVLPVRADLSGALSGWWRLSQGGTRLPADQPLSRLDPKRSVEVERVDNRVITAEIQVPEAEPPARLVARVGTAVPVASLADHLVDWLSLPAGRWELRVDGQLLGPHAILADIEPLSARPVLELRLASRPDKT